MECVINMRGYSKEYDADIIEKLNNYQLDYEDKIFLNSIKTMLKKHCALVVIDDIYKLYKLEFSTHDIAKIYDKSLRAIQQLFKKIGLNRSRKEAQRIAVNNRDYVKIRKTFKKTMKDRFVENQLFGTNIEQVARAELMCELNDILDAEIIVGMNTMLYCGEIDIPIIIIKNNITHKYGVEIDGLLWHDEKQDINNKVKISKFEEIGYKIHKIRTKSYSNNSNEIVNYNELRKEILKVCKSIKDDLIAC